MGALIHTDKHLVLNNRYALLGCIAVSGAGKIYRGRDLEQVKYQGQESRILIHVLPTTRVWPLAEMFQQLHSACQQLAEPWILGTLAYGQDNGLAYFVLESPDAWELQSLLNPSDNRQVCYRSTRQRINPLVKRGYLEANIDPALLVCAAKEELHLLATALAPQVQALDKHATHRQIMRRKHVGQAFMTGTLLTLFAVFTAVAGNAALDMGLIGKPALPASLATGSVPQQPMMLAALPSTHAASVLVTQYDHALRGSSDERIPLTMIATKPLPTSLAQQPAPPEIKSKPKPKPQPPAPTKKSAPIEEEPIQKKAAVIEAAPEQAAEVMAVSELTDVTDVVVLPEQPIESAPSDGHSIDELIQQAYAAMNAGRLGGKDGALSFTRQLREQAALHPQVARLGQEITAAYLEQVRAALQANDGDTAARLLPETRQLIGEFNLLNLNPAQQVLEEKVKEFGAV